MAEFGEGREVFGNVFGFRGEFGVGRLIRHLRAQAFDTLVVFDRPAVLAVGVHLIADQKLPDVRFDGHRADAFAKRIVAVLRASDFDIAIADHVRLHRAERSTGPLQAVIESRGEETGFEPVAAKNGLLRECDALDCEQFLGIRGPVEGDGVGFEVDDLIEFFETHDGEGSTAEGVLDERIFRVKRERVKREIEIGHG